MTEEVNSLAKGVLYVMFLPKDKKKKYLQEAFGDFTGSVLQMAGAHLQEKTKEEKSEDK